MPYAIFKAWNVFWEIRATKVEQAPITFSDLRDWCSVRHEELCDFDLNTIMTLDSMWITEMIKIMRQRNGTN